MTSLFNVRTETESTIFFTGTVHHTQGMANGLSFQYLQSKQPYATYCTPRECVFLPIHKGISDCELMQHKILVLYTYDH